MDWNNLQTWHYGAMIGGAVILVGLIVSVLPARRLKVPGSLTAAAGAAVLGLALGIIWMAGFGYKVTGPETETAEGPTDVPKSGGGPPGMGKGGMGKGGGAPKGGGFGGGNAPSPRTQLAGLVTALDRLVDRPVTLTLTPEDRSKIAEQLKGLDSAAEVNDEDAEARLEAILKVLEKDRKALESVGYRWPSPDAKGPKGGFGGPKDSPNPFAAGNPKEHLKSLQERLEKK